MKFLTMRSSIEWYVITTRRPPGFSRSFALLSISCSASTSLLISMRSAWNTFAISFFSRCGGQKGLAISMSSLTRLIGFSALVFTILEASLRAQFSSPYSLNILASSSSLALFSRSAAVSPPRLFMRMSRSASKRNENPRVSSSKWCPDTPRSASMASTCVSSW